MARLTQFVRSVKTQVLRDRKGSLSILAAVSMTAVVGFAGLGSEVTYWYVKERNMQSAADSAAIAGAAAMLAKDTSGNATTAATTMAAQYGFTGTGCGTSGTTVICVNNPPKSGTHTTDANAWEVTISQTQTRLFTAVLMPSDPVLAARAVATQQNGLSSTAPSCVVTLDKTTLQPDLQDNGNASVNMTHCNVFVDSCDPNGALMVSGNGQYTANASYACGSIPPPSGSAKMTDTNGTYSKTGTTYADPYGNTTFASLFGNGSDTPPCQYNNMTVNTSQTLQPGVYCGGLAINGGTVTLSPGAYIIEGTGSASATGFQINGNANVTGNGVTVALTGSGTSSTTWASVQINGGATVNLSAPMPGNAQGSPAGVAPFVFYQNPKTPTGALGNKFNGNANDTFQGALYFPHQQVTWNGNSGVSAICTQLVVYQLTFNGTNNFQSDATNCQNLGIVSLQAPGGTSIALVE